MFSHICLYVWFILCILAQINHINSQILVLYGYITFFLQLKISVLYANVKQFHSYRLQ